MYMVIYMCIDTVYMIIYTYVKGTLYNSCSTLYVFPLSLTHLRPSYFRVSAACLSVQKKKYLVSIRVFTTSWKPVVSPILLTIFFHIVTFLTHKWSACPSLGWVTFRTTLIPSRMGESELHLLSPWTQTQCSRICLLQRLGIIHRLRARAIEGSCPW